MFLNLAAHTPKTQLESRFPSSVVRLSQTATVDSPEQETRTCLSFLRPSSCPLDRLVLPRSPPLLTTSTLLRSLCWNLRMKGESSHGSRSSSKSLFITPPVCPDNYGSDVLQSCFILQQQHEELKATNKAWKHGWCATLLSGNMHV